MKFTPTNDRVLVKRVEEKTTTEGGIVIPDQAVEKPDEGIVIAVAPASVVSLTRPFSVGSRVLFSKYAGTEIEFKGAAHLIIHERDILGVLSEETERDSNAI
jgi:chaperonin GroES